MRYRSLLATPNTYDIERAVAELDGEPWTVRDRDIKKGDRILLWKAKGRDDHRGLVALGEAISEPYEATAGEIPDFGYWNTNPDPNERDTYIDIQYVKPEGLPLWLDDSTGDLLERLKVSRSQGGPVFYEEDADAEAVIDALGGWPDEHAPISTSDFLRPGTVHSRKELRARFDITDATINNGIFPPKGHRSVWLFVTEDKTADRRQYKDELVGNILYWQSQPAGRKDHLVIEHEERDLELLLFYRTKKDQFDNYGFTYEGRFRYVSHEVHDGPSDFVLQRVMRRRVENARVEQVMEKLETEEPFDPENVEDGRQFVERQVARRMGQAKFRRELLHAYQGRCAVTGCDVSAVLEAAHIFPYRGKETNHVTNGLLLRSDIHMLFDQGLLAIHPETLTVLLAPELEETAYSELEGKAIAVPKDEGLRPSEAALDDHLRGSNVRTLEGAKLPN